MKHISLLLCLFLAFNTKAQLVSHKLQAHSPDTQCIDSNTFCFTDSIVPVFTQRLARATYLFSDGSKYEWLNPNTGPIDFCHSFKDPAGGRYTLTVELEDTQGYLIKQTYMYFTTINCNTGLSPAETMPGFKLSALPEPGTWLLSGKGLADMQFELLDISGRQVAFKSVFIDSDRLQIQMPATGMYVLTGVYKGKTMLRYRLLR